MELSERPVRCLNFVILFTVLVNIISSSSGNKCPKDWARMARSIIIEEIQSRVFENLGLEMPASCPLNLLGDVYGLEETAKRMDAPKQWTCRACGKGFYDEKFIDLHLKNRHPEFIRKEDEWPCLANYCDILRCKVFETHFDPADWSKALCREEDFYKRMDKCQKTLEMCFPNDASEKLFPVFNESFYNQVCGYLTCDNYWTMPDHLKVTTVKSTLYILAFILVTIGLCIYYYLLISSWLDEAELQYEADNRYNSRHDDDSIYYNRHVGHHDDSVLDGFLVKNYNLRHRSYAQHLTYS